LCRFQEFPEDHIYSFSFLLGVTIMLLGFGLGYVSDRTLLALRSTGTYQIPRGGMFEYVSAPHFLGECLEWWGFALACHFSLAAVSFALWTMANLVPRALAQQAWYHLRFPEDYPKERKAILLFLL
jgi:steroid 5-alpha reductase family enzyme